MCIAWLSKFAPDHLGKKVSNTQRVEAIDMMLPRTSPLCKLVQRSVRPAAGDGRKLFPALPITGCEMVVEKGE
jgi:hypothetical protein